MLWCTGLGSNSLTGSPKRNTNGCATYTYRCHPLLTTNPGQFWGRPLQVLFVIGMDAGQLGYSLKTKGNGPLSQQTPFPSTRVAQFSSKGTTRNLRLPLTTHGSASTLNFYQD